jgi:hypothetical protein
MDWGLRITPKIIKGFDISEREGGRANEVANEVEVVVAIRRAAILRIVDPRAAAQWFI